MNNKELLFMDTETYSNKAFLGAQNEDKSKTFAFWIRYTGENVDEIREFINGPYIFVTFNGLYFDLPIIGAMYAGKSPQEIKHIANSLIEWNVKPWIVTKSYPLAYEKVRKISHIDLIRVAPQPTVNLKMYGARLNAPSIIENPFHHESVISDEDEPKVENYCINGDLELTRRLFKDLEKAIDIRVEMSKMYGVDMRSKTDSQMAEQVFVSKLGLSRNRATYIPEHVTFNPPDYLKFKDPTKQEILEKIKDTKFEVHPSQGHVIMPSFLEPIVRSKTGRYQMGIGGLHSIHDKKICYVPEDDEIIEDIDAASYYPTIMLLGDMVPKSLGREFLNEYRTIYDIRMEAKKNKDQVLMDTLRIALNGTFGKTADRFSPLYSPDLMIAIVLTGQLTLLHLIELLEEVGVIILSANTDGIIIKYRKENTTKVHQVLDTYTKEIGYIFDKTRYRCVAMKDVNNYFAVKMDRTLKAKGLYAKQDLRKNPMANICNIAVGQWLAHGTSIRETIRTGKLEDYLYARSVKEGCYYGSEYLGYVVRWYKSIRPGSFAITSAKRHAKIARTDNSTILQAFPPDGKLPSDIDYEAYFREAIKITQDIGASKYHKEGRFQYSLSLSFTK